MSPLLSLMRDQDDKLAGFHVPATRIDSSLGARDRRDAMVRAASGAMDLVYVTPEDLAREDVRRALVANGVAFVVVDEAHCISAWGHDFRPAYAALGEAIRALGGPPILALTGTATPEVECDIVESLGLRAPRVVRTSCERTALSLEVVRAPSEARKREALERMLSRDAGSGIVYCATLKTGERVWSELVASRPAEGVGRYHGDLPTDVRGATQSAFMDGRYRVVVATKAFGMGIDKPDVRFVVHYELRDSLEDRRVQEYFLGSKHPSAAQIARVLAAWRADPEPATLAERSGVARRKVDVLLHEIARVEPDGVAARVEAEREHDRRRLRAMETYAEHVECRWAQLLRWFGETPRPRCERCDVCCA